MCLLIELLTYKQQPRSENLDKSAKNRVSNPVEKLYNVKCTITFIFEVYL